MKLAELLSDHALTGADITVQGLSLSSRNIKPGYAFIAVQGARQHGLAHVRQALELGASAVLYEPFGANEWLGGGHRDVPFIAVEDLNMKLGEIASRFYGDPSGRLHVIGITGTNGKTSCSQFLAQALDRCGIIGTLGWGIWGCLRQTINTTPDALAIQWMLANLVDDRLAAVAMEVSSHGLEQGRVNGIRFQGVVYTNISRDHLDYHGSMERYVQAKLKLLAMPGVKFAVINLDDAYSQQVLAAVPDGVLVWAGSLRGKSLPYGESVLGDSLRQTLLGIELNLRWRDRQKKVCIPLFGEFNAENALTVFTTLLASGMSFDQAAIKIESLQAIPGRMERYGGDDESWVFVDYAHTPDALEKVLKGLRKQCEKKLTIVFGCGGDRDEGKRSQMGSIAQQWADRVILTDDNPRGEAPEMIVEAIMEGCRSSGVSVIHDRALAIQTAISESGSGDCVLIAGKGHEEYQEVKGRKIPFSDRETVIKALRLARQ
ncbi:UDP-N-acetylmuramoyl-L-alanyl-D-glutamate--2,6-diaminopimelate ligase [Methylotuvimicrobium sp. KM2]|uniref:UDP-N-acetylmuramoyl-L-alanyl-D-glutamate--2, 6-diaminopimelate ligase n=1 Tax=Methylotuvimicrobium sp. KM2 TaxID=3133976 RepID=UPI00310120DC